MEVGRFTAAAGCSLQGGRIERMAGHAKVLNPRQVVFAQALAGTLSPDNAPLGLRAAALRAGYKDTRNTHDVAHNLSRLPLVIAEIERQRAIASASRALSAAEWMREARRYLAAAWEAGDLPSVGRALEVNGRALGVFVEHSDGSAGVELASRLLAALAAASQPALPIAIDYVDVDAT